MSVKSPFSKLVQVGAVVSDIDKAMERLSSLGIGPFQTPSPPPGAEGMYFHDKPLEEDPTVRFAMIGDVEFELLQPGKGPSPWKEYLDKNGEGIHHLAFRIDDVEKAVADLTKQGASVILTGKMKGGKVGAAYLDLGVGNIIVELM